nr:uncharacterized protein I203_01985 [Kwoniella mangroviensis CBS 8507]OCF68602.1 hypothetical protein I203_01985 [Kwoniella mangroviensis CBS 8507]
MARSTRTKPKSKSKSSSSRTFKRTDQITSSSTQSAGPSSHSQAQPTSLPNEIILQIFTCLSTDQASLLSCSRVSKTFHKLSSPLLWHHLRLSPFFAEPRLVSANGVYVYRKIEDPQKAHCGSIGTGKKDLKPLLKHVEKFYLESHTPEWCLHGYNTSLKLPNLQILELDILSMRKQDHRKIHLSDPTLTSRNQYNPNCRLLRDLTPSTIVLRDNFNRGLDLCKGSIPISIWKCVEELVLVSPVRDIPCLELEPVAAPIPITLKNLERLTWIFHPPSTSNEGEKVMYKLDAPHRPDLYNAIQIINLIIQLKNLQSIKLVNAGILASLIEENSRATEDQLHWESRDYILGKFGAETRKMGWTEGKIGEWKDKIEFLTFEEWEGEQGWVGRLEQGEVEGWKEAMRG